MSERGSIADLFPTFDRLAGRRVSCSRGRREGCRYTVTPVAFELYIKGLVADTPDKQSHSSPKPSPQRQATTGRARAVAGVHRPGAARKSAGRCKRRAGGSALSAQARLSAGVSELALKRFDDAFNRLRALAEETGRAEALNDLGVVQLQRGPRRHSADGPRDVLVHEGDPEPPVGRGLLLQPRLRVLARSGDGDIDLLAARSRAPEPTDGDAH